MKHLLPTLLLALVCGSSCAAAAPTTWTEHRRALLINASADQAHATKIKQLQQALEAKGFVATIIGDNPGTDGVTYEQWVRSIPTMGVSVFYYCGHLETQQSADGKRLCHSMKIGGYRVIPPARDPDLGRARVEDKPWLSLERLSEKLGQNVARANMVVIDCLGINDRASSGKSTADLYGGAAGLF
ncbi:MAG: hypothetical protein GY917_12340, partial [Planctomycetaceae bacterium]|nr:hypothetical protein [Planctomycetaceae bacterium]